MFLVYYIEVPNPLLCMGSFTLGIPTNFIQLLQRELRLDTFVEGGTFRGDSSIFASNFFSRVITVEKDETLFLSAQVRLQNYKNIAIFNGCTTQHIVSHVAPKDRCLFWLDAHWSCGETAGEDYPCPLLEELELIFSASTAMTVLLIDDARQFLAPPPYPHNPKDWPRIDQIIKIVPSSYSTFVYQDVIYIVPLAFTERFSSILQPVVSKEWEKSLVVFRFQQRIGRVWQKLKKCINILTRKKI